MATKFRDKAAGVRFDLLPGANPEGAKERPILGARTAIGSHADALYRDKALAEEADRLRSVLQGYEGSLPTKLLDPNDIVLSKFANRHADSFKDAEYLSLKAEIKAAGGNKQPIGVRPLAGKPGKYELGFGSRRRQACLDEGLLVLALIEEMDDAGLFERMERENRQRKDLRPYEQGVMYAKALDEKLYPSAKKMAADLEIDPTGLGRLLSIARLPQVVLAAFPSPLDIQYAWGPMLNDALQKNPDAVVAMASALSQLTDKPSGKVVLDKLVTAGQGSDSAIAAKAAVTIAGSGKQTAKLTFGPKGNVKIDIKNLAADRREKLELLVRELLA